MQAFTRRQVATILVGFACTPRAIGQTMQYRVIEVGNRVSLTVPGHWRIRDASERQNIAASADALLNPTGRPSEPMHVSSLSVVSAPEPPQAIIRVSFVADTGSQADLQRDLARGRADAIAELATGWKEEAKALAEVLTKQGMRYLGNERFDFQPIGSKMAIVISYRRTSARGGSPFVVTQYHVPMGADKVLVTLSLQESSAAPLGPILERVKNSIVIRR
jgi:hypothetical protein